MNPITNISRHSSPETEGQHTDMPRPHPFYAPAHQFYGPMGAPGAYWTPTPTIREDYARTLGQREAIDLTAHRSPSPLRVASLSSSPDLPEIGEIIRNVPPQEIAAALRSGDAGPSSQPDHRGDLRTVRAPTAVTTTDNPRACSGTPPIERTGNLVSVTITYTDEVPGSTARAKPKLKKVPRTKSDHVNLVDLDRTGFARACLAVHDLEHEYDLTLPRGPDYLFWPERYSGGKSAAPVITTDHDYEVMKAVVMKKSVATHLNVIFDLDDISRYKIRQKRIRALDDDDPTFMGEELSRGTRVPHLDAYSGIDQLHGTLNLKLKRHWACHEHLGEHGGPGVCFVTPLGKHIGVNNRRSSMWTAAIVAGDATIYQPPNISEFDGDGSRLGPLPRGRTGPHPPPPPPPPPPAVPATSDHLTTLVTAAMIPLLQNLSSASQPAHTAIRPSTPAKNKPSFTFTSPMPSHVDRLRKCLTHFERSHDIPTEGVYDTLCSRALTPDLIPRMALTRLCELTGMMEGHAMRLQEFCTEWVVALDERRGLA